MDGLKTLLLSIKCCLLFTVNAQPDSLYINTQPRDGITRLNGIVSCQRQIITAEQIRLSGFNRLSDIFQLIDAGTFSTINGDRWYFQSNGTSNYQDQNWILMVNGQRIDLNRSDATHVNMLGISITEIERIEVVNTPGLYLGEFADKGIIHIITKKNTDGISYRGYYNNGNETGDPGPYQFTPYATDNVDKIGLNYTHVLGYGHKKWSINTAYTYQDYFFRDTAIFNRVNRNNPPTSKSNLIATRFELNYSGTKVKHQLQGNYTEAKDYLFEPTIGKEIQADIKQYNGGYITQINFNPRHSIRFATNLRYQYTRSPLDSLNNPINQPQHFILGSAYTIPELLVSTSNFYYQSTIPHLKDFIRWQLGITYDYYEHRNNVNSFKQTFIKPYTSISLPVSRKATVTSDFRLASSDLRAAITLYKRVSILTNWSLVGSYSTHGYNSFLRESYYNNPMRIITQQPSKIQQLTFDFNYAINIGNNFKMFYNSGIKQLWGQPYLEMPYFNTINILPSYVPPTLYLDKQTTNWINRFNIHHDVLRNMFVDFNYLLTSQLSGDAELMSAIPRSKITFIINYQLPERFNIWSRMYYQSSTTWLGLNTTERSIGQSGNMTIPSFLTWDVGVSKKLLKDYLNLNFTIRNLFNGTEKYHPLGAQFDLRLMIGVSWTFNGMFAGKQ